MNNEYFQILEDGTITPSKRRINFYGWSLLTTLVLILLSCVTSLVNSSITKQAVNKINAENQRMETIEKHNDILWTFVADIDSCSTVEEVKALKESLFDNNFEM